MPETLTVEDRRRTVAELVKNGLPTKVIAKRLNLPLATVLSDKLHLSVPNPDELANLNRVSPSDVSVFPPTTNANRQRREAVRKMYVDGWNDQQIADALKVSAMTIKRDRDSMGLESIQEAGIDERRMKIKELLEQNLSLNEIAEQVGTSVMTVIRDRRYLGFEDVLDIKKSAVEDRRVKIAQMVEDGMPCTAIARELGLETRVVRYDCEQMGILDKVTKSAYSMRTRQRKEDIIEMYSEVPNVQKIANHFGIHPATVKRALKEVQTKSA